MSTGRWVTVATVAMIAGCTPGHGAPAPSRPPVARVTPSATIPDRGPTVGLARRLHVPSPRDGTCPTTPGRYVATPHFGSMALGRGVVRVGIDNAGRPRPGFRPATFNGWLALKTHFFSYPSYHGPVLVRARRVGTTGRIRIGPTPANRAPLVIPAGHGWREQPYFTFVTAPGCYAWQIDGTTFSYVIVVHVLTAYRP